MYQLFEMGINSMRNEVDFRSYLRIHQIPYFYCGGKKYQEMFGGENKFS